MNYVYGPIPSRRLGRSLGVDPIPLKTCNWNCVYCQLGRSLPLTNERRAYAPQAAILDEISDVLGRHQPGDIDFISFVGSGEPTLHSGIGWLIRQVKAMTTIPVAVITNGTLLYLPEVGADLLPADVVMPTLSAGTVDVYRRIHRPHPEATFARLVDGIISFRQIYSGQLWIEVMLIQGVNDSEQSLRALASIIRTIGAQQVHVVIPDRPPAEPWVAAPDSEGLMRAVAILGPIARVVHPYSNTVDVSDYATPADAILGIVTRQPMSQGQLGHLLTRWSEEEIAVALANLELDGQAHVVERLSTRFWTASPSFFPTAPTGASA
jgi:wyosine [tRNA(Phe)-imidazoG37] synthetase (radical SAM superfamily)